MAQQWKDLLFCLAGYWYFSLCPERLSQFTAHDLGRGRKSQTHVPPFSPPVISVHGGTTHPPTTASSSKLTPTFRAAVLPPAPLGILCSSLGFIIQLRSDPEHNPWEQVTSPAPSRAASQPLPMLMAPQGMAGTSCSCLDRNPTGTAPLMLSWYFQPQGEQEAQGYGKTKQGSEPSFLTPPSRFAPFSLKLLGTSSGQDLPYHELFLPGLDTISSFHHPAPTASPG